MRCLQYEADVFHCGEKEMVPESELDESGVRYIYNRACGGAVMAATTGNLERKGNLFDGRLARSHRPIRPSNMSLRQVTP